MWLCPRFCTLGRWGPSDWLRDLVRWVYVFLFIVHSPSLHSTEQKADATTAADCSFWGIFGVWGQWDTNHPTWRGTSLEFREMPCKEGLFYLVKLSEPLHSLLHLALKSASLEHLLRFCVCLSDRRITWIVVKLVKLIRKAYHDYEMVYEQDCVFSTSFHGRVIEGKLCSVFFVW